MLPVVLERLRLALSLGEASQELANVAVDVGVFERFPDPLDLLVEERLPLVAAAVADHENISGYGPRQLEIVYAVGMKGRRGGGQNGRGGQTHSNSTAFVAHEWFLLGNAIRRTATRWRRDRRALGMRIVSSSVLSAPAQDSVHAEGAAYYRYSGEKSWFVQ